MSAPYNDRFYKDRQDGSLVSARAILPLLIKVIEPKSVIDLGCGTGSWLSVFKNDLGISDVLGVDGDYVDRNLLEIDQREFFAYDLKKVFTPSKKFDLAMSVEVGEHLPEICADNLVKSLTDSSDFILFSAAVTGQTGTDHINEQEPKYWAKKFADRGFICVDYIRKQVWDVKGVDVWYKQNILLYIKQEVYEQKYQQKLAVFKQWTDPEFLTRIHPDQLVYFKDKFYQTRSLIGFIRYHLYPIKRMFIGKKN